MLITTIGDSITGSAKRLRQGLLEGYHPDWAYVGNRWDGSYWNDGVAGDTSADVVARLDTIPPCDKALLLVGTNDWIAGLTKQQTVNKIQKIVDTMVAQGATMYVLRLLPRLDRLDLNQRNADVNVMLMEQLTGATIINTWQALMQSQYPLSMLLQPDKLHLTPLGYDELVARVGPET